MEIVDVINNQRRYTGERMNRGDESSLKNYPAVIIWTVNKKNEILIQKRTMNKSKDPGKWATLGGGIKSGETAIRAIKREMKEEYNLEIDASKLEYIATYRKPGFYMDIWIIRMEVDLNSLTLQESEVDEVKFVTMKEFEKLIEEDKAVRLSYTYFKKYITNDF